MIRHTIKHSAKFSSAHYEVIAKIIREIPDDDIRQTVGVLLGDGFNKRSTVFDFYQWRKRCNIE